MKIWLFLIFSLIHVGEAQSAGILDKIKGKMSGKFDCKKECESPLASVKDFTTLVATGFKDCSNPELFAECQKNCSQSEIPKCFEQAKSSCNYDPSSLETLDKTAWNVRYGKHLKEVQVKKAQCIADFKRELSKPDGVAEFNSNFSLKTRKLTKTKNPKWTKFVREFEAWLEGIAKVAKADVYACDPATVTRKLIIFDGCISKGWEILGKGTGTQSASNTDCSKCDAEICKNRDLYRSCFLRCPHAQIRECLSTGDTQCYVADPRVQPDKRVPLSSDLQLYGDIDEIIQMIEPFRNDIGAVVRGFPAKSDEKRKELKRYRELLVHSTVSCSQDNPKTASIRAEMTEISHKTKLYLLDSFDKAHKKLAKKLTPEKATDMETVKGSLNKFRLN